jgi:DNA-binding NarL/FixJ family response regulator
VVTATAADLVSVTPVWNDNLRASLRVVLADDHAVVRAGLKSLVNSQQDMHVVGEAPNGGDAVSIVRELLPDVIVMDLSMPAVGGADATTRIATEFPTVKVVALTVHEDPSYLAQLLKAGACGYVLKRSAPDQLVHAIRAAAAGGIYIDPSVAATVVQGYLLSRRHSAGASRSPLSDRERAVLVRIARGYRNQEIAEQLGVSIKTVETYKARFVEKLGIRTRVEIARYAAEQGLDDNVSGREGANAPFAVRKSPDAGGQGGS